jgi:hydroxymethylpyrimidine pyrophosphatase-like HAD family hydrolase
MSDKAMRFIPIDTYQRDPGEGFRPEDLQEQKRAFAAAGGKVDVIPFGVTKASFTLTLREHNDLTAERMLGRRGPDISIRKIRMECPV